MKKNRGLRRATALALALMLAITSCFMTGAAAGTEGMDAGTGVFTDSGEGMVSSGADIANMADGEKEPQASGEDSSAFSTGTEEAGAEKVRLSGTAAAGSVSGENKAALAGLTVRLYDGASYDKEKDQGTVLAEAKTDEKGMYEFKDLAPGTYRVEFVSTDENFHPENYQVTEPAAAAEEGKAYFACVKDVEVTADQTVDLSLVEKAAEEVLEEAPGEGTGETAEGSGEPAGETTGETQPEGEGATEEVPGGTTGESEGETTEETETEGGEEGTEGGSGSGEEAPELGDGTGEEIPEGQPEDGTGVPGEGGEENPEAPEDGQPEEGQPEDGAEVPGEGETTEEPEQPSVEETTPETETLVEMIADEINLRTTPFIEEDNVAATASMGQRFTLIANANVGGEVWYKILYVYPESEETAELYVRSDFAQLVEAEVTETPEAPEEETPDGVQSEATELVQELTDADGNVVQKVTASLPEGAFAAETAAVTMEVTYPDAETEETIKGMMAAGLPEGKQLGAYALWNIQFKVNGEAAEAQKPITVTVEGCGLNAAETGNANVFYLQPADPENPDSSASLQEIPQRSELMESLTAAGESTENIEEYDLAEIGINENGTVDSIVLEGRKSTVYGCFVEEKAEAAEPVQTLTYEDEQVVVNVSAAAEGIIPEGATLSVTPITAESEETKAQYEEVAQQIQEKAVEEEKEVAGFLAYDISLIDTEGNKLEPSGEVKVTMNYKEAAIPEEVWEEQTAGVDILTDEEVPAENAEQHDVSVMHFVEDAQGEVAEIVDMSGEGKATVETTEAQEVQVVEFETDSFSVYTVTWTRNSDVKAVLHFVDTSGNDISDSLGMKDPIINININTVNGNLGNEGTSLNDIGEGYYNDSYEFKEARLDSYTGTVAIDISYNHRSDNEYWHYKKNDGSWSVWKGYYTAEVDVYLVYSKPQPLPEVDTIDLDGTGIVMRMNDYNSAANGLEIGGSSGEYGSGNIKYGLLHSKLQNGYPVTKNGTSLSSLFSGGIEVNHLFLQDEYTRTGYYEYSSFNNYAYLNVNQDSEIKNFKVYDALGTPSDEKYLFYQRGNFMPYNRIKSGRLSTNTNLYNPYGKPLASGADKYGAPLYKTVGTNNFFFGMYLESNFLQPKDGQALFKGNKSPMRYEFNGDDDLWVFIDDVLVLDIGGIHDAHSGYIDFSTGEVVTYDCTTGKDPVEVPTTILEMFEKAGADTSGFEGNTFKDYTKHTFKMFYMERGEGASNLHMRFNLQVIPDGQIQVTKELKQEDDPILYGDVQFGFELYIENADAKGNGLGTFSLVKEEDVSKYEAKLKDKTTNLTDLSIDVNGRFYLKPNQTALFNKIPENLKYYVSEVDVKSEKFDEVRVNDVVVENKTEDGDTTSYSATSPEATVAVRPSVTFTNSCSVANKRTLQIEKKMQGNLDSSDTFYMKLEIEGDDGALHPYSGKYTVFEGNDPKGVIWNTADTDGYIAIQKDQIATVYNILSETKFKVTEVNYNTGTYLSPSYQVSVDKDKEGSYIGGQEGEIQLNKDAKVIVTNRYKTTVSVKKVWKPSAPAGIEGVYVGLYKMNGSVLTPVTDKYVLLNQDNQWEYTFIGLDGDVSQYVAKELYSVEADGNFVINEQNYSGIEEGGTIIFAGNQYGVNYNEQTGDGNKTFTITNTAIWQIIKISENKTAGVTKLKLAGAEFMAKDSNGTTYTGISDPAGVVKWYDQEEMIANLPGGKSYTVTETKAPSGYMKSEESWVVDLTGTVPVITYKNSNLQSELVEGITTFYFENKLLYALPSTGGTGIFVYLISGVMLMMAAALIIYKNRCREVLKR